MKGRFLATWGSEALSGDEWSFLPSEAYDALVFCNAVSGDSFYAQHYPSLREEWGERLGQAGLDAIEAMRAAVSMSSLAYLLSYVHVGSLEDVIACLLDFDPSSKAIDAGLDAAPASSLVSHMREALREVRVRASEFSAPFIALREAGFAHDWREEVGPGLEVAAANFAREMEAYPLAGIRRALAEFLGDEFRPAIGSRISLVAYSKPIAFTVPGGLVAFPEALGSAQDIVRLALHEALHGFPGSHRAVAAQERLRSDPVFDRQYRDLTERWDEGPEEYLVTAAEAYLAARLGLRTAEETLRYLHTQNGGMPLSLAIYRRLRDTDLDAGWPGYGPWVAGELEAGRIAPDDAGWLPSAGTDAG